MPSIPSASLSRRRASPDSLLEKDFNKMVRTKQGGILKPLMTFA